MNSHDILLKIFSGAHLEHAPENKCTLCWLVTMQKLNGSFPGLPVHFCVLQSSANVDGVLQYFRVVRTRIPPPHFEVQIDQSDHTGARKHA